MPIIITITNGHAMNDETGQPVYDYSGYDRLLHNIFDNEYEVFYSGQNKGQLDWQLTHCYENNELFKIYYRHQTSIPYTYLGETTRVQILQERQVAPGITATLNEKLHLHLIVRNIHNVPVPVNNFTGSGKFKKDILVHAGLRTINNEIIIDHNKNTNIGFYYYSNCTF